MPFEEKYDGFISKIIFVFLVRGETFFLELKIWWFLFKLGKLFLHKEI